MCIRDSTFDLICYVIFIGFTILLQINVIGAYFRKKLEVFGQGEGMPIWAKALLVIAALLLLLLTLRWLVKKYPHNRIALKLNGFVRGVAAGFDTIRHLKKRKQFLAHTIFIWAMYLLQIYIGFFAMQGTMGLNILAAFSVLSLATLAMIITCLLYTSRCV